MVSITAQVSSLRVQAIEIKYESFLLYPRIIMASSAIKPTVLIVPGAWHKPSAYSQLATHLESAGFPTATVSLPGINPPNPKDATCARDTESVRERLISLIEPDGKDVVVIAHSYGGVPAGGAAHGLSKSSRSHDGKSGGVLGLIYMTAHMVPEGTTIREYFGKEYSPWVRINEVGSARFMNLT